MPAIIATASRHGVFRVAPGEESRVADSIRALKGTDPTLGIYAAYAYNEVRAIDQIAGMAKLVREEASMSDTTLGLGRLGRFLQAASG